MEGKGGRNTEKLREFVKRAKEKHVNTIEALGERKDMLKERCFTDPQGEGFGKGREIDICIYTRT